MTHLGIYDFPKNYWDPQLSIPNGRTFSHADLANNDLHNQYTRIIVNVRKAKTRMERNSSGEWFRPETNLEEARRYWVARMWWFQRGQYSTAPARGPVMRPIMHPEVVRYRRGESPPPPPFFTDREAPPLPRGTWPWPRTHIDEQQKITVQPTKISLRSAMTKETFRDDDEDIPSLRVLSARQCGKDPHVMRALTMYDIGEDLIKEANIDGLMDEYINEFKEPKAKKMRFYMTH